MTTEDYLGIIALALASAVQENALLKRRLGCEAVETKKLIQHLVLVANFNWVASPEEYKNQFINQVKTATDLAQEVTKRKSQAVEKKEMN